MRDISATIGPCLLALFVVGCAGPTAEVSGSDRPTSKVTGTERQIPVIVRGAPPQGPLPKEQQSISVELIQKALLAYPVWRVSIATPGFECALDAQDVCHVKITVFQSIDTSTNPITTYCMGVAPRYVLIRGKTKAKKIKWELELVDPKTGAVLTWNKVEPPGSTLDFLGDEDHGILIMQNIYDNQNKPQLKEGKRGKDSAGNSDRTYSMKNDHKENGTATYLPIIVHTLNPGLATEEVALCGTPDPVIYNVN